MSNFELYPHQTDILQRASPALAKYQEIIVQSPTGSGKSLLISETAKRALAKGKTVLVLSETTKIFRQLVDECAAIQIDSNVKHIYIAPGRCYCAMAQTLQNRPFIINQLKLLGKQLILMPDECHIGRMNAVIEALNGCYLMGFTATPHYRFAKHLPQYYKHLVTGPQVDDLIQSGHLCSYEHIARTNADLSGLKKVNGEYSEASQEKTFGSSRVYAGLYADLKTVPFTKAVIFVASIKHCEETYLNLVEQGFSASRYHSNKKILAHPEYELAKFTTLNESSIIVTVAALTKGWDHKPIDLVVLNRKTASTVLYLQMIGRGSRPIAGKKDFFRVLDYGENFMQHQYYWDDRNWEKLWNQEPKKKDGVAAIKTCPNCEALVPASTRQCPFCKHTFTINQKELEQGELVVVTAAMNELKGKCISDLTPQELSIYAAMKNKKQYAARIAKAKEQKSPGWLAAYAQAVGYKPGWVTYQLDNMQSEPIEFFDFVIR